MAQSQIGELPGLIQELPRAKIRPGFSLAVRKRLGQGAVLQKLHHFDAIRVVVRLVLPD
jgi:hypothetical protein